jgi:hypothetical protein
MINRGDLVFLSKRFRYLPTRTVSRLSIDGKFFCFVLEDVVREDGVKVFGETAIPAGTYRMTVNWSNRFKRRLIYVHAVPMFEGIRIHPGLTERHTHGCLLVSRKLNPDFTLARDRQATEILTQLVDEADDHRKCWLVVQDEKEIVHLPDTAKFTGAKPVPLPHIIPTAPATASGQSEPPPPSPLPAANNLGQTLRLAVLTVIAGLLAVINWLKEHALAIVSCMVLVAGIAVALDIYKEKQHARKRTSDSSGH